MLDVVGELDVSRTGDKNRDALRVRRAYKQVREFASHVTSDNETLATVELLAAEVITNALVHGTGLIRTCVLFFAKDKRLRVVVRDSGPRRTGNPQDDSRADYKRGLTIVAAFAVASHRESTREGTCAWFEVAVNS